MATRRDKVKERKRVERKRKALDRRRVTQMAQVVPPSERAGPCHVCDKPISFYDKALVYTCDGCDRGGAGHLIHRRCCPECSVAGVVKAHDHMEIDLRSEPL